MLNITFLPDNITIEKPEGSSLLEAARSAGVFVETPCGGKGTCQKCRVKIVKEKGTDCKEQNVLICQAVVPDENISVVIPESTGLSHVKNTIENPYRYLPVQRETFLKEIFLKIPPPALLDGLSDADRFLKIFLKETNSQTADIPLSVLADLPEKLRAADGNIVVFYYTENAIGKIIKVIPDISQAAGDSMFEILRSSIDNSQSSLSYGIAVDIGTTTAALWLVDLKNGKVLSARNAWNSQAECALDVIGRINYAKKFGAELKERILKTINTLILEVCDDVKIKSDQILCVSITGNTTMIHLLLGIIPEYIRLHPYTPVVFQTQVYTAAATGISACENAPVLTAPAVGSYVGGDITAGLLCTSLALDENDLILFIDIGTNGEIVLGNGEFIFACACSAGPAFEGGRIKCGMRAGKGAIEKVVINKDGKPEISVIGGGSPKGICGSGIISAAAELFRKGIIDSAGKFCGEESKYMLCEGIAVNETDIDSFIRAKGAIFSACQTMLDTVGMSFGDLKKVYVAGGFGNYLDLEDAGTVGLLPRLPDGKITFLGNSSVVGAYLSLVSEERRLKVKELAGKITYIDLSSESGYMDHYTGALFLPHTDKKLFE